MAEAGRVAPHAAKPRTAYALVRIVGRVYVGIGAGSLKVATPGSAWQVLRPWPRGEVRTKLVKWVTPTYRASGTTTSAVSPLIRTSVPYGMEDRANRSSR